MPVSSLPTVTLRGILTDSQGQAGARGRVWAQPVDGSTGKPVNLLDEAGHVLMQGDNAVKVDIGTDGAWSLEVLPTDTAGVTPAGWALRVMVKNTNSGQVVVSRTVLIPGDAAVDGDVWLDDLADVTNPGPLSPGIVYGPLSEAGVSSWNDLEDKPATFPPSSHTHPATDVTGLATVATSGAYTDLTGKPTLGTAAAQPTTAFDAAGAASAAQAAATTAAAADATTKAAAAQAAAISAAATDATTKASAAQAAAIAAAATDATSKVATETARATAAEATKQAAATLNADVAAQVPSGALATALNDAYAHLDGSGNLVVGSTPVTVPDATTSASGVVELATSAEGLIGTDVVRAMTPAAVKAVTDAIVAALVPTSRTVAGIALSADISVGALQSALGVTGGVGGAPVIAVRTSDATVNNTTTLADDTQLVLALAANATYEFRGLLSFFGSSSADATFTFTGPTGATALWTPDSLTSSVSSTGVGAVERRGLALAATGVVAGVGSTIASIAAPRGIIKTGSTAGNLTLRWAQATLTAADVTLQTNSYLLASRIA